MSSIAGAPASQSAKPPRSDVFLSFNSRDAEVVATLALALENHGLAVWIDRRELRPGQRWQRALESAIQHTKAAVVCIGPHGLGEWQEKEARMLVSQAVERDIPIAPLFLPGAPALKDVAMPLVLKEYMWSDCREGLSAPNLRRLASGLRRVASQGAVC